MEAGPSDTLLAQFHKLFFRQGKTNCFAQLAHNHVATNRSQNTRVTNQLSEVIDPFSEARRRVGESVNLIANAAEWVDDFAQLAGNSANLAATRSQVMSQFGKANNFFSKVGKSVGESANPSATFVKCVDCFAKTGS